MKAVQDSPKKNQHYGLKYTWKDDMLSGFMVFLLALPLSLAIAKASDFPASAGVLTAIIGGMATVFFQVSPLTIKGPAAGLITICSAAVLEFGGGSQGWQTVSAILLIAAIFQVIFGLLKLGSLSDFFPRSAVFGMLGAIGLMIVLKHIPVLLGVEPSLYAGMSPFELLLKIPGFIQNANAKVTFIGGMGLLMMFVFPLFKAAVFQKIPAPLFVLLLSIPLALFLNLNETVGDFSFVFIGDFWSGLGFHFDFSSFTSFTFWKYVFMLLFINSLKSLLTVKAVDQLSLRKIKANPNSDLIGLGAGNFISGLLGGMPMISEVVRSSANINYGAKSKWSNFFHGLFLLLAMVFLIPLIEMIPNAALAAMLIYAGYRLASPKEFLNTYRIGKEQLAVYFTTILVTLAEDLLLGVAAGILIELLIYWCYGSKVSKAFSANFFERQDGEKCIIHVTGAAQFSNLIGFKNILEEKVQNSALILDFSDATLVDHSFMIYLNQLNKEVENIGGKIDLIGLDNLKPISRHAMATRVSKKHLSF